MSVAFSLLACASAPLTEPPGGPAAAEESDTAAPAPTDPFEGEAVTTDGGLYTVLWAPDRDPWTNEEPVALELRVEREGAPEAGAGIEVVPWMPTMGHGIAGEVSVSEPAPGAYLASWSFSMPGPWEIGVTIDGSAGPDGFVLARQVD